MPRTPKNAEAEAQTESVDANTEEESTETTPEAVSEEVAHLVVEDDESWLIYHRGAHAASMNTMFPVYDGWIEVRDGCARIPKDRPDWAQRLLRFENFAWCHGPEEAPESFLAAIGAAY